MAQCCTLYHCLLVVSDGWDRGEVISFMRAAGVYFAKIALLMAFKQYLSIVIGYNAFKFIVITLALFGIASALRSLAATDVRLLAMAARQPVACSLSFFAANQAKDVASL